MNKDKGLKMANVIKYHLSHDGNPIGLFNTLDEAEYQAVMDSGWTEQEYKENFQFAKSQCGKYGGDVFSKTTRPSLYFFEQVELDEKGDIVSINGNPINELIQEILDGSDDVNDNFIAIKQKVTEYYTM